MMNYRIHAGGAARALVLVGLALVAGLSLLAQNGNGPGPMNGPGTCALCGTAPLQPLTATEIQWLVLMREEEKLARDVYTKLYQTWKLSVFSNIARSEQRHFDAVGVLIERYGVTDPALAEAGKFSSPTLQALYDQLVAKGLVSAVAALQVGVAIEQQDIDDLEKAIAQTTAADVKRVYANLLAGSQNHLEAFQSHLEILGVNP
jgi:hypothetical protein